MLNLIVTGRMLLAIREVVKESTGFSPNELVFGHTVRGPIALLADEWRTSIARAIALRK